MRIIQWGIFFLFPVVCVVFLFGKPVIFLQLFAAAGLMLWMYALSGCLFYRFSHRPFSVSIETETISAGSLVRFTLLFSRRPVLLPGFIPAAVLEYPFNGKIKKILLRFSPAEHDHFLAEWIPECHGEYLCDGRLFFTLPAFLAFVSFGKPFSVSFSADSIPITRDEFCASSTQYSAKESIQKLFIPRQSQSSDYRLRQYCPGDDLRRLHWKQYARTGMLVVRTGEPELPQITIAAALFSPDISEYEVASRLLITALQQFSTLGIQAQVYFPGNQFAVSTETPAFFQAFYQAYRKITPADFFHLQHADLVIASVFSSVQLLPVELIDSRKIITAELVEKCELWKAVWRDSLTVDGLKILLRHYQEQKFARKFPDGTLVFVEEGVR